MWTDSQSVTLKRLLQSITTKPRIIEDIIVKSDFKRRNSNVSASSIGTVIKLELMSFVFENGIDVYSGVCRRWVHAAGRLSGAALAARRRRMWLALCARCLLLVRSSLPWNIRPRHVLPQLQIYRLLPVLGKSQQPTEQPHILYFRLTCFALHWH